MRKEEKYIVELSYKDEPIGQFFGMPITKERSKKFLLAVIQHQIRDKYALQESTTRSNNFLDSIRNLLT